MRDSTCNVAIRVAPSDAGHGLLLEDDAAVPTRAVGTADPRDAQIADERVRSDLVAISSPHHPTILALKPGVIATKVGIARDTRERLTPVVGATLKGDTNVVRAWVVVETDCVTDKLAAAVDAGLHAVADVTIFATPRAGELPVIAIADLVALALRTVAAGALPGDAAQRALPGLDLTIHAALLHAIGEARDAVALTSVAAGGAVVAAELALLVLEEAVGAAPDGVAVDALHAIAAALIAAPAVAAAVRAVL